MATADARLTGADGKLYAHGSTTCFIFDTPMRLLHTMLRVGDLQRSIDFYTRVMGMTLLRTTERPEQGYSLAFVGYGSNPEQAEIELTYNHGVGELRAGHRLRPHRPRRGRRLRGLRQDPRQRRHGHARGRPGQGRHDGDRLRHRSRRLQDRADRARRLSAPRDAARALTRAAPTLPGPAARCAASRAPASASGGVSHEPPTTWTLRAPDSPAPTRP